MTHNKLVFQSAHKSITGLRETTLPKLVVLTGRNGSGKTHLLEAIKEGYISSSVAPDPARDISLFDWNNIVPKDTGAFSSAQMIIERYEWFQQIKKNQDIHFREIREHVKSWGVPEEEYSTINKLLSWDKNKIRELFPQVALPQVTHIGLERMLVEHAKNIYYQTRGYIPDTDLQKAAEKASHENPMLFWETSESKFFNNELLLWAEVDAFQQAFGRLFSTYRELLQANELLKRFPLKNEHDITYLEEEDFIKKYGECPWDFVNRILEVSHLDFQVIPPLLHEKSPYEPKLKKISKNCEIKFQDLSSGEKVLMSFAICLYNAKDSRQGRIFPKLLLLDEIDAPLHPSMALSLINTIHKVLVEEKGISVILTTHSPSTVALAPEEALYEMNPTGPCIEKISTSRALAILTAGVPTLSVSFDGRRQVFVESKTDAFIYENIYQKYKQIINNEKSLTFIEVGKKSEKGLEQNAGCTQVSRIVKTLVENGNGSVFGLIDWDGKGEGNTKKRVHVLSPKIRDGVESLILDPLLLAAALIKENPQFCIEKEIINKEDSYTQLEQWEKSKWQSVIEKIQSIVIDGSPEKDPIKITYLNGITLDISRDYLHMDDHKLEKTILEKFAILIPRKKGTGGLANYIINSILADYPRFLPDDLISTFRNILEDES